VLSFIKPSVPAIRRFLASQADSSFSYPEVGCTLGVLPAGYNVDRHRVQLGEGPDAFDAACGLLRAWQMFRLGWVSVAESDCPIEAGCVVGILARIGLVWTLNACRIVEVVNEPSRRCGFAYGTLADHVEQGEERFLIERDEDDAVWFDILAVSRPACWYAKVGYPITRHCQHRFRVDSANAMRQSIRIWAERHHV